VTSGRNGPSHPDHDPKHRLTYLEGVVYGFQIGRDYGFGEGVAAMRRAVVKVLQEREKRGGHGG
jgi:hypothetical protein